MGRYFEIGILQHSDKTGESKAVEYITESIKNHKYIRISAISEMEKAIEIISNLANDRKKHTGKKIVFKVYVTDGSQNIDHIADILDPDLGDTLIICADTSTAVGIITGSASVCYLGS